MPLEMYPSMCIAILISFWNVWYINSSPGIMISYIMDSPWRDNFRPGDLYKYRFMRVPPNFRWRLPFQAKSWEHNPVTNWACSRKGCRSIPDLGHHRTTIRTAQLYTTAVHKYFIVELLGCHSPWSASIFSMVFRVNMMSNPGSSPISFRKIKFLSLASQSNASSSFVMREAVTICFPTARHTLPTSGWYIGGI